jgi:ElaA protein
MKYQIKNFPELSSGELYEILKLRQQVFIVEQQCIYLDCDDKDQKSYHVMLTADNGRLAAYARVLPPGISYPEVSIGRVVSSTSVRRTGAGKKIMEAALDFIAKTFGDVPVRIGAQSYLIEFYRSFGFEPLEDYMEDGIPHTIMLRKAGR